MSDVPEKPIKPSPPQAPPVLRPAASQVVSMPVVLISAAVVLAVAATVLVARHGSKRSASELAVPPAQVQASAGPAGVKPATMAEVPDTEAAPAIEGARNTAANPTPTAENRSEELGVEGPAEERPMVDGMGQASPAEYGEQGPSTGYARRRW